MSKLSDIKCSKLGWITTKHGKPYNTPDNTKRGLLIGWDFMALKGLGWQERRFMAPPYKIMRTYLIQENWEEMLNEDKRKRA